MRRTSLRRAGPPERRTRLRPQSPKRRREQRERRRNMLAAWGDTPLCAAQLEGCEGFAADAHEVKTRARGGSITDPANVLPLCRSCHTFVTGNPVWAETNGFLRHSWEAS